jgi:putative FmdB family regulatory protein
MPIYEFECEKCGETFDALLPVGGEGKATCPKCKSKKVKKLLSSFFSKTSSSGSGASCSGAT